MIQAHGGKLISKHISLQEKEDILNKEYKKIELNMEQVKDVNNIANGVYSPLQGFLKKDDFKRVVSKMRLKNGLVWPIPIVLDIDEEIQGDVLLTFNGKPAALLKDTETYKYDKDEFCEQVFKTKDRRHPGVDDVYRMKDFLIGGEVVLLESIHSHFPEYDFTPIETRAEFQKRGWETIVAFQTRNVPHRGHEFVQKQGLKEVDGLFIQPVIGEKKIGDFKDEYILISYDILIKKHYPENKAFLGILPLKMRYAGPREAVFHALIRKNFGCTHFIVGRDHAGVGDYYGPLEAIEIFKEFKDEEIGINILALPEDVAYWPEKGQHFWLSEVPEGNGLTFGGRDIRKAIDERKMPEEHMVRPVIFNLLVSQSTGALVDEEYKRKDRTKGFTLWFTGLSQAGKTTVADGVAEVLKQRGMNIERFDGDVFRKTISKDLGFSKQDRAENVRRVGLISRLLSNNGAIVINSFMSPYKEGRKKLRKSINKFIEVYCNCPFDVCEQRDVKGVYARARKGEMPHFIGLPANPYEESEDPEIELHTDKQGIDECINKIISYLESNGYI